MINNARGEAVAGAAERWDVSADGRVYVFHLRKGLVWSDGEPLTADDFVFSFRRLADPATAASYASNMFVFENGEAINQGKLPKERLGVRALDPLTLELRLHTPVPYLLEMLTHAASYAVPRHVVEKKGAQWVRPGVMVTSGAYTLVEWRPHDRIRADKNPRFYDAANVAIDQVFYYPTEDEQTALKQFRAGELDSNDQFPARQYGWLKTNMPQQIRVAPWLGLYYYAFNSARPPFTDKRVRQALSMSIPREDITDKLLAYGVIPAYSIVPPGVAHYPEAATAPFKSWSREKRLSTARALLREAGYGPDHPLEVTISYNSNKDHKKIALAVAYGWKQIGVTARLFNVEAKVHYNNLKIADFEVARAAWIADYNDPENFLFLLDSHTGQLNYGQYDNPRYDALMAKAARTLDLDARAKILHEAEAMALGDMPIAPIYFYVSRNLVQTWVKGWEDNIMDAHPTRYLKIEGRPSMRR
nr:peptide ABC transporter substrate-binding protein [Govania unica]